jgi:hypothetical protein
MHFLTDKNSCYIQINSSRELTRQNTPCPVWVTSYSMPFSKFIQFEIAPSQFIKKKKLHYLLWSCRPVSKFQLIPSHACTLTSFKILPRGTPGSQATCGSSRSIRSFIWSWPSVSETVWPKYSTCHVNSSSHSPWSVGPASFVAHSSVSPPRGLLCVIRDREERDVIASP